jgi:hypothetical protein
MVLESSFIGFLDMKLSRHATSADMPAKAILSTAWVTLSGILYWILDHFLCSWLVIYLDGYGIKEASVIASISSYVIPALLSAGIIWAVYQTGRQKQLRDGSAAEWQRTESSKQRAGSPLQIEFGNDDRHERATHIDEAGIFRRTILVSVFNESLVDIVDCNLRLIAATPRPRTGDDPTRFPAHFGGNFDLQSKQRKFIQIVSFAENPENATELERDHIIISLAAGGYFPGWTTIPIPPKDNPAILTLEAYALGITSRTDHLHIWVDHRRLHAKII